MLEVRTKNINYKQPLRTEIYNTILANFDNFIFLLAMCRDLFIKHVKLEKKIQTRLKNEICT